MDYTVAAVDKALGLLFLVAQHPGLGVTELAKRSGNTKARAFRLLGTLEQCGLIRRQADSAGYSLGYKALLLGSAAQEQLSLVRMAKASLPDFVKRCNESVLVRVREGLETVCIAWLDAPHAVRVHTQMGNRRPLYAGASGKLLLGHAPPQIQEAAPQYLLIPAESVAKIGALIQRQQAEIERLKRGTGCASGNAEKS